MEKAKTTYQVWVDPDTGNATTTSMNESPERVAFGGHLPAFKGTRAQVNRFLSRIKNKPSLIERFLPAGRGGVR